MPNDEPNLLALEGLVTAPAGCGKTQLIAEAGKAAGPGKPLLLLTHTHAGVAALRARMLRMKADPKRTKIATLDGWAMTLVTSFPVLSGHNSAIMVKPDYPKIRFHAAKLVQEPALRRILQNSYSRVSVDEYQDCSVLQHEIVSGLSEVLPTVVLADPLQAIFGFGDDPLADWAEVQARFKEVSRLSKPWRWINAGQEKLGQWLLAIRPSLEAGQPVDLSKAPASVTWVKTSDLSQKVNAAKTAVIPGRRSLIIGTTSPEEHKSLARRIPGTVVVEAVDLKGMVAFADQFDPVRPGGHTALIDFAATLMTGLDAEQHVKRINELRTAKSVEVASIAERRSLAFLQQPSFKAAAICLASLSREKGMEVQRRAVLDATYRSLLRCAGKTPMPLPEAARRVRDEQRARGRELPDHGIGSTLLLKGLESDAAVVLHPEMMNGRHLYVALTRGASSLTVCSPTQTIVPSKG
ncbi:MAG: UvrD-helicase domain-containing protein [Thermoplasmatota archaeon]